MPAPVIPQAVQNLITELARLPGIGPKSASRLTFFILRGQMQAAQALAQALTSLHQNTSLCVTCYNITDVQVNPCPICADPNRDASIICVVEQPMDVIAIQRTGYKGLYHVLHGALSPIEGIGPSDIRLHELVQRVANSQVREVILATNPSMEGEATAMYIQKQLHATGVRLTRPARGLPMGGDLEYADEVTLTRALEGRRDM